MLLPQVSDSLAGRLEALPLLPFSMRELAQRKGSWLDLCFASPAEIAKKLRKLPNEVCSAYRGAELFQAVITGGYPEARLRTSRRRAIWMEQYLQAILTRDVREIATIEKLDQLPRLLKALAQMSGQLINFSNLANDLNIDQKTIARYLAVLEQVFLVKRLPAWSSNQLNRLVKAPKLQFLDSGLLSFLLGLSEPAKPVTNRGYVQQRKHFGVALEGYVYAELQKQASWSEGSYLFYMYRDKDQLEVDLVIENDRNELIGVEVKASTTPQAADFKGLRRLAAQVGDRFLAGVVLYDGEHALPMGDKLWAMPIASLAC